MEVLDLDDGLPTESGGVADDVQFRIGSAVEHNIKPIVLLKPFRSLILISGKRHFPDMGATLHLNEADLDSCVRVFGMRLA